jgi:hypothetical protein
VLDSDDASDTENSNSTASDETEETEATEHFSDSEPRPIKTPWRPTILRYTHQDNTRQNLF